MAAEDESPPGLTLFGPKFRLMDTTRRESASGIYPLEEVASQDYGPTTTRLAVIGLTGETVDRMEPLHEIDTLQEDQQEQHPRRLFCFISRALPILLTAMVIYIYYIYAIHVCIQYLLKVRQNVLQACFYLVAFTTFILLFFFSYALCIFRGPGSPSNPPVRTSQIPIPPTTTPYHKQRVFSDPVQSNPNEAVGQGLSPTGRAPSLPRSRSTSDSTSMRSIAQHSNPQLASIVSTPKYPTASVAPVIHGTHAYSFPSHNGPEFANIQAITNVATDGTTQRNVNDSSSESEGSGIVVESGRISIEIPHQVPASMPSLRSRHPSDDNRLGSQQSIATLSVSERDGLPRWCDICKTVKPDRSHHCSECNSCVLRMDHHCPWVNGCIGFGNYKYFYLFIFYGSVSSIWVVVTMVPILVQVNNPTHSLDIQWIAITAIAFLLMLMIVSFTGAHTFYILGNRTTIEVLQDMRNTFIRVQYQKMDQAPEGISDLLPQGAGMLPSFISEIEYNVVMVDQGERLWDQGSWLANWNTVMGPTWWLWFVPCHNTLGDGIHDVYNEQVYSRLVGDALAQARVQAVNFGLPSDLSSSCNTGPANGRNIGMSEGRVAAGVTGISTVPQPPPRPDSESTKDIGPPGSPSSTIPATRDSSSASPGNDPHPSVVLNMDVCRVSTSAGGPSIPRKSSGLSGSVLIPSIRPESPDEDPTTSPSTASGRPMQTDQSEYVSDYYYQPPRLNQLDIPQDLYADEGLASQEGGSGGGGNSTPKRSTRNQSSRQRSLKSLSASPARRRQRTMSGGTGGSYAGPIKEFGMGLGMDGVPVDSGTGLKLSSGLRGWSSQSQGHSQGSSLGHGHGKGYPRQQQQD